ncbi:MAG TPA: beta-ketoacyl synthase N-terminal-like domain-containing protein [Actinocrinis sp.]
MPFPPIAIVGRGCVLPGALTPAALWDLVVSGRSSIAPLPQGRWRVPRAEIVPEHAPHDVGGYVTGFDEVFDSRAADGPLPPDPAARWVLHAARQALDEVGPDAPEPARSGLILGWLALPDERMTRRVEQVWCEGRSVEPGREYRSVAPAGVCARVLGFGAGSLTLDAACASSLYAVKFACDRLHDGRADLMLAGGVSGADPLLVHAGFAALSALSPSGRSRPFQRGADGLVPAEGAALVALMRLPDAVARGIPVLGVIRGIGLGNDGRGDGLLVPSQAGQVRAMQLAYTEAGIAAQTVTLLECHATGTARGDAVEVRSAACVFDGARGLPIGSAKASLGHAMTAAGAVGLLKVLAALEAGIRPLTPGVDDPLEELRGTPLRVLYDNEPWDGPRRAAVSAFGFGGNNAHLVVDAPDLLPAMTPCPRSRRGPAPDVQVAVVGIGARVAGGSGTADFTSALLAGTSRPGICESVALDLDGLRFPPADLRAALAGQVLALQSAREAARGVRLPADRCQVMIEMTCDPQTVGHTARLRHGEACDVAAPALDSARVVGFLANMAANRVSSQLDLAGPSFAVGAARQPGVDALGSDVLSSDVLALAVRAIRCGEADAALVGAVDVSCPSLGDEPSDVAIALALKRLDHARRDGDRVMAVLDPATADRRDLAAVAADVLALHHRARLRPGNVAIPWLAGSLSPSAADTAGWIAQPPPSWHVYSGVDRAGVLAALDDRRESREGPARLVIVAADASQLAERAVVARRWLLAQAPRPRWAAYRDRPLAGALAFVYPGGAAAYQGMCSELALAFPDLVAELIYRCPALPEVASWVHDDGARPGDTISLVWGAAYLAHVHTAVTRGVLGLAPAAALGYSSGESTALTALGAWPRLDDLVRDLRASPLFSRELAGSYDAVRRAWQRAGLPGRSWRTFVSALPADRVREALAGEPAVHLMAVNSPQSCTFGGETEACERVLVRLGAERAVPLNYDLAVHAPVLQEVAAQWRELHTRPTVPVPGVTFYGCARAEPYALDPQSVAEANTAQALGTVDFRGTVGRAWADGVRIFVEHGPGHSCTDWIAQTLDGREHLALALDGPGPSDLSALACAVADLIAAGVQVDDARLADRLAAAWDPDQDRDRERDSSDGVRRLSIAVHPPLTTPRALAPAEASGTKVSAAAALVRAHHATLEQRHRDFVELARARHADFLAQSERISRLLVRAAPPPPASPLFDRAQLEFLASGPVSALFGPAFAALDRLPRQTRLPGPPMLLVDRVLTIDAVPGSMGTGAIRTQTDVRPDSWYLDPAGRMPAALMVEAGQADLLLISWLGVDLRTRGERVYRLLGCEITYHGSPPCPGQTLTFDIAVDGHADQGPARLFFFHYDCRVDGELRLSVRGGQAGFFTDAELAGTRGVLWQVPHRDLRAPRRFERAQIAAFAEGRFADCFGAGFAASAAQVRPPRPAGPGLLLFDEIEAFDPDAGYLRARLPISPQSWFFEGHFAGDPCMPGTLMLEGCFQLMAFHLTALGHTAERDGWRFEPVPQRPYRMSCRAQATPSSSSLTYEVFVSALKGGARPTLVADVLCTVDGTRALLAEGLALQLVPDWPLEHWRRLGNLAGHVEPKPVAQAGGVALGLESLLACAWGRPSEMMGDLLAEMDDGRRLARLPGPPYHFVSRIIELGDRLVAEYDVPHDAWYWSDDGDDGDDRQTMPFCVLLEAALQPCGWLALHTGDIPRAGTELLFRNLDGRGTLGTVGRATRVLRTEVRLADQARHDGMIIDAFDVRVLADGRPVGELRSVFGFFPPAAFAERPGLGPEPGVPDERPEPVAARPPGRPPDRDRLDLLDRITGFWPRARRMRAQKDIAPGDWYFRAHFFQDPVQPGSLGLQAMLQLVQCYLVHTGAAAPDAEFEPWLDGRPAAWTYRGQVTPHDAVVTIDVEITETGAGHALAEGWLSVDGRLIYHAENLGVRVVGRPRQEVLDPAVDTWLADHRPTWTVPALPMMSVVDRLAAAAGRPVGGLRDVRLGRWIVLDGPVRLRGAAAGVRVELEYQGTVVASASVVERPEPPPEPAPLRDAQPVELPYLRGGVFHGPAFHYLTGLEIGSNGAHGVLDAAGGSVPRGLLHQGLLDASVHAIPHDELWRWSDRIRPGCVGYPYRLPSTDFFEPLPDAGLLQVDARFAGFDDDVEVLPVVDVQVHRDGRLLLAYRLVEVLVPLGPLARLGARERAAFLRDRRHVPGCGLSVFEDAGTTRLRAEDLRALEWFPGTVAHLYGLPPGADPLAEVAVRDHVAHRAGVHPSAVLPSPDLTSATVAGRPQHRYAVELERVAGGVIVRDAGPDPDQPTASSQAECCDVAPLPVRAAKPA